MSKSSTTNAKRSRTQPTKPLPAAALKNAEAIRELGRRTLANVLKIGELLVETRDKLLDHGQWLPFLKLVGLSRRSAARWMRCHRERDKLGKLPDLPLSELYRIMEQPSGVERVGYQFPRGPADDNAPAGSRINIVDTDAPEQQKQPPLNLSRYASPPAQQKERANLYDYLPPPAAQAAMSDQELADLAELIIQVGSKVTEDLSIEDARRLIKAADRPQVLLAATRKLVQVVRLIERAHGEALAMQPLESGGGFVH